MPLNALAFLGDDHRRIEQWLADFQATTSPWREEQLAFEICSAIRMHLELDAKLFYPALLTATGDRGAGERAQQEHQAIITVIDAIERAGPTEDTFFANVFVLGDLFKRHIHEEEKSWGVFEAAKQAGLDLESLGQELQQHKRELMHAVAARENSASL